MVVVVVEVEMANVGSGGGYGRWWLVVVLKEVAIGS